MEAISNISKAKPITNLKEKAFIDYAPKQSEGEKETDNKQSCKSSVNTGEVQKATEIINETLDILSFSLKFEIHESTERVLVKVVDKDSGDIIREIPPEKILDMIDKMKNMVGLLIDEKA